ncbi:hypothetical protein D3C72_1742910 [compost metagenome]
MQHPALRQADVQALARAGDRHVHEAAFFFQPGRLQDAVLVREQPFFQPGDEDGVELQALGGMHRHELDGVLALLGLVVAGFQRGVRQEARKRGQPVRRHDGRVDHAGHQRR